jgi:hypothetical protein
MDMNEIAHAAMVFAKIAGVLALMALLVAGYFLPTIVAGKRDSKSFAAIAVLNLLGGATGIFWLVALAWACFGATKPPPSPPGFVSASTFAFAARAAKGTRPRSPGGGPTAPA